MYLPVCTNHPSLGSLLFFPWSLQKSLHICSAPSSLSSLMWRPSKRQMNESEGTWNFRLILSWDTRMKTLSHFPGFSLGFGFSVLFCIYFLHMSPSMSIYKRNTPLTSQAPGLTEPLDLVSQSTSRLLPSKGFCSNLFRRIPWKAQVSRWHVALLSESPFWFSVFFLAFASSSWTEPSSKNILNFKPLCSFLSFPPPSSWFPLSLYSSSLHWLDAPVTFSLAQQSCLKISSSAVT